MIVLQRKRILMVILLISVSVFTYIATSNSRVYNAVQVVSLPVTNKVVILDAGHGKPDERDCLLKF